MADENCWQGPSNPQADGELPEEVHRIKRNRDIQTGQWHKQGQELVRLDQYITPLKTNKLGPTEAQCFERLACLFRTDSSFLVTKRVSTPHVPFGKAFCSSLQWYARADSPGRCNLRVSCQVDFTGFVGPLKGLIHRSSMEGMREHHQIVLEHLRQATAGKGGSGPPPGASSRTRVAAASGAHSKDLTMLPARQRTIIKVLVAALVAMAILVMALTRFAMELDEELTRSRRALVLVNDTGCALPSLTTLP